MAEKNAVFTVYCPNCSLPAEAVLEQSFHKFILYKCPRCKSNVVCYSNKISVISDNLVKKLLKQGKLKFCGSICFDTPPKKKPSTSRDGVISESDIMDLRILLETESDSFKIIYQ